MDWRNEAIITFLEEYRSETCIWNSQHPDHKSRHKVIEAWERLHKKLNFNCTLYDLKKKKESLMASFRAILNKKKRCLSLGESYQPSWFAYDTMEKFLAPQYYSGTATDLDNPELAIMKIDIDSQSGISELDMGDISEDGQINCNSDEEVEKTFAGESYKMPKIVQQPTMTKKRKCQYEPEKQIDMPYYMYKEPPQRRITHEKDDCELYTELLAKKLHRLDEEEREEVMLEIDTMLLQRKKRKSQRKTQYPTPSPSYTDYTNASRQPSPHTHHVVKEEKNSYDLIEIFPDDK